MGKKSKTTEAAVPTLSGFLLAQVDSKDAALDDIFANSKGPSVAYQEVKKEKKEKKSKKSKKEPSPEPVVEDAAAASDDDDASDEDEVENDAELSEAGSDESLGDLLGSDDEDDEDDAGVEEAYAARAAAARLKAAAEGAKTKPKKRKVEEDSDEEEEGSEGDDESAGDSDEEEMDIDNLQHESLLPKAIYKEVKATSKEVKKAEKARAKAKSDETPEQRDARTIFIGNVPVSCSTTKNMKKALIRHVLKSEAVLAQLPPNCPPLKADSIRFRSLAFASTVFGRKATTTDPETGETVVVEAGGRGRKRAREWRDAEGTDERGVKGGFRAKEKEPEKPAPGTSKGALTDGQKRRVAFIRGELNEGKKACNAYLVLEALPASFTGLAEDDLLKVLVNVTNGSTFEGYTLRADHVRPRSSAALLAAAQMAAKPNAKIVVPGATNAPSYTVPSVEARRTLFIGGLDFAESEENVRAATEAVMVRERGASGAKGWVEGVRIIRDASSGLGKGFGYVLLRDDSCVDELLALPPGQNLKVSKRRVRLERCKTGIAAARAKANAATREQKEATAAAKPVRLAAPRDPTLRKASASRPSTSASDHQAKLADALAKLPAEERKAIKAIDPERLQRRAEKKKQKVLSERYERKQANESKKGGASGVLGRESRGHQRARKEKKRVQSTLKGGRRAKPIKP